MSRFMIAAAHKSSGKTVVATGLAAALGEGIQTFKKGPDYIDPMWLSLASGKPCYNLDFNVMDRTELAEFFSSRARKLNLIEANKGLFDGVSLDGSDSNAEIAKLLKTPVVLVVDTNGITRGIAPLLMGYQGFDADVNIAGIILNKVGGHRHESKLCSAVEQYTDIPVLGSVSRSSELEIGERHLGLTTPAESGEVAKMIESFKRIIGSSVDPDRLKDIANSAPDLGPKPAINRKPAQADLRIAIARDHAFGFYYPDDLESFADNGVELVPFDSLKDQQLPKVDGLFIGGGFPEMQMAGLAANSSLRADIKTAINAGLPTYAECGGLMYLCDKISWQGEDYEMVGAIPGTAAMHSKPQGRGYVEFENTTTHLWEASGNSVSAHEFHYASIEGLPADTSFARKITRGIGSDERMDAIVLNNMVAGFCHLRSNSAHPWVSQFVDFVRSRKSK